MRKPRCIENPAYPCLPSCPLRNDAQQITDRIPQGDYDYLVSVGNRADAGDQQAQQERASHRSLIGRLFSSGRCRRFGLRI